MFQRHAQCQQIGVFILAILFLSETLEPSSSTIICAACDFTNHQLKRFISEITA